MTEAQSRGRQLLFHTHLEACLEVLARDWLACGGRLPFGLQVALRRFLTPPVIATSDRQITAKIGGIYYFRVNHTFLSLQ